MPPKKQVFEIKKISSSPSTLMSGNVNELQPLNQPELYLNLLQNDEKAVTSREMKNVTIDQIQQANSNIEFIPSKPKKSSSISKPRPEHKTENNTENKIEKQSENTARPVDDRSETDPTKELEKYLDNINIQPKEPAAKSRSVSSSIKYSRKSISSNAPAPSISELTKKKKYNPDEEDQKRELIFKFSLLEKTYPFSNIPKFTVHSNLTYMQRSYDDIVRKLSLDSTVDSYKTYLIYAFMGCEFLAGQVLGLDMQGFTQQQIISIQTYEKLLIELGEKSYFSTTKFPVEVRLIMMVVINAAFFVFSRMLLKKTGSDIIKLFNNIQSQSTSYKKMKQPDPDLFDSTEEKN